MSEVKYEYAVQRKGDRGREVHRGPMTELQARAWVREAEDDGFNVGYFRIVRREVHLWENAPTETLTQESK